MARSNSRAVTVQVRFADPCDGVVRLVNDAQRFGFTVRALTMEAGTNGDGAEEAVAHLDLLVPDRIDLDTLAARFARHPAVHGAVCEAGR